jgi:pilus assembly protein Flp/PilA
MDRREPTGPAGEAERHLADRIRSLMSRFRTDTSGATAIEYGMIAALTFLTVVGALRLYGDRMTVMYEYIGTKVGSASS